MSLFLPMFTPTGAGRHSSSRSRPAMACMPSLLNPKRLISAACSGSRKARGLSLPGWGRGVTVPTSTAPKPSAKSPTMASAFLSSPAATPTGLGKSSPATCMRSDVLSGIARRRSTFATPGAASSNDNPHIATSCARSASRRKSRGLSTEPYVVTRSSG